MVKLSKTGKMNAKSWSLQAVETCPGSKGADGALVAACSGCYATTGAYTWPATIAAREHNRQDWERDGWVQDMVQSLRRDTHFRWFDSGDMYSLSLAEKIYQVMVQTPQVRHWLPTRMAKFPKFKAIIDRMMALANVAVRFSSDSVTGEYTPGVHGSTIYPAASDAPAGTVQCTAYTRGGKCGDCYACYDKAVPVIAYPSHGHKMARVIKIHQAPVAIAA
jgi:hypothetical protein